MTNPWTPGPWRVQRGFLTIYSLSHGDVGLTCAIASVLKEQPEKGQPEANARLIAAAPEMADLLARFDETLNCGCRPCTGDCTSDAAKAIAFDVMRDEARALLNRIRGGQ